MTVTARVTTGLGVANQRMRRTVPAGQYANLGITPALGTLNLATDENPRPLLDGLPFKLCNSGRKHVSVILRTESGESLPVWVTAFPKHLELLATVHLRSALNLNDGDTVQLTLPEVPF